MAGNEVQCWGIDHDPKRGRHAILVTPNFAARVYNKLQGFQFLLDPRAQVEQHSHAQSMVWLFNFFGQTPRGVWYPDMEVTDQMDTIAEWGLEAEVVGRSEIRSSQPG